MKLFGKLLLKLMGWKIVGEFPKNIKKSITIFAPHTSTWDAIIGKIYLVAIGLKYHVMVKHELFRFPLGIIMRMVRAIPIDRSKGSNITFQVANIIESKDEVHILLFPEGTRDKVDNWKKGFYLMAKRAEVPIVVGYLDYAKKEIGMKGVVSNTDNITNVMTEINEFYKDLTAKHPENFVLEVVKQKAKV